MTFKLASNLTLPPSAVTDTWAWFGTRGTGKTYAAGATVEAFIGGGAQVVIVDPVGVWYGLRLAQDGRGRGLDIPVFGGLHADVPLEPTGGELVAQIVTEQGVSVVLDVSMLTLGQQHRFVLAFATALFNLKKSKRTPIFVLFDEAHEFMPQSPGPAESEMLGAVRRLWKMGRNFGIGVGLVSPRPAEVNKGVVNLTERMFCGRLKGSHDRKAMESWAKDQEADASVLDEIPRLPSGELMFWAERGPERVRFFPKKTFDASKTPERGDARPSEVLPKIDLEAVRTAMTATIEEAKANDPKALRAQVIDLQRQLAGKPAAAARTETVRVEVPVFPVEMLDKLSDAVIGARQIRGEGMALFDKLEHLVIDARALQKRSPVSRPVHVPTPMSTGNGATRSAASTTFTAAASSSDGDGSMRILRALAARHPTPLTKSQVGTLAVLKPKGGSFRTYVSKLVTTGRITRDGVFLRLTAEGLHEAGPIARPSTPGELVALWRDRLTGKSRDMLEVFAEGEVWTKSALAQRVELDVAGGSFRTYLSKLKANGLIEKTSGGFQAVESLRAA